MKALRETIVIVGLLAALYGFALIVMIPTINELGVNQTLVGK